MRKIGDALRLRAGGLTLREIAASLGVGRSTVGEHLKRCGLAGLSWPLPEGVSEADLEQRLSAARPGADCRSPTGRRCIAR